MMQRTIQIAGFLSLFLFAMAAEARDWPEIPRAEWDLKEVANAPGAPAVVLLDSGELRFDDRSVSSYFEVYRRVKILNEEGREHGTVSVPSSNFHRMRDLEGRTHLPDGRVVPLGKDAKFEKKFSTFYKFSLHSFAMPAVEVGSIIEYQYRIYFDSAIFTEPWYFQGAIPRLRSEITCEYPKNFGFAPVRFSPYGLEIQHEMTRTPVGQRATYSMENVPPVPDEVGRFPFQDLSSWALFIPRELVSNNQVIDLLKDWKSAIEVMQGRGKFGYKAARKNSGGAKTKAKELAGNARNPLDRALPIYEFVRDEIRTEHWTGVSVSDHVSAKTFKDARGDYADKALLLQTMLSSVKVDSSLGWVRSKDQGQTQLQLPTPWQFDKILVVLELDGKRVFLDPTDTELPFGHLPPDLEGIPCLLVDEKKPDWVTTPVRPAEANSRWVQLQMEVGEEGGLTGTGNLSLKGLHAWAAARAEQGAEDRMEYWSEWIEDRMDGFQVTDVEAVEDPETPGINLRWKMSLEESEILGDEITFQPSVPLAVRTNVFSLPPGRRRTPVRLAFADVDTVEVTLRWPEGWTVDSPPKLQSLQNGAGRLETAFEVKDEERSLVASRTLVLSQTEFVGTGPYTQLHELYSKAAVSDAETVILVRE